MNDTIKVKDYGDMLAQVTGKKLISFTVFGSYQGDWIAALESENSVELWKGYYGSCSGCDWLEDEHYESNNGFSSYNEPFVIPLEKAKEFFKEDRPFLSVPKSIFETLELGTFMQLLPANTRADIFEFEPETLLSDIREGLK